MLMPEMTLLFEDPERSPDRGVARRVRHRFQYLAGCRFAGSEDDVHHFALAPAERLGTDHAEPRWCWIFSKCGNLAPGLVSVKRSDPDHACRLSARYHAPRFCSPRRASCLVRSPSSFSITIATSTPPLFALRQTTTSSIWAAAGRCSSLSP